jgi:hypothetical protein
LVVSTEDPVGDGEHLAPCGRSQGGRLGRSTTPDAPDGDRRASLPDDGQRGQDGEADEPGPHVGSGSCMSPHDASHQDTTHHDAAGCAGGPDVSTVPGRSSTKHQPHVSPGSADRSVTVIRSRWRHAPLAMVELLVCGCGLIVPDRERPATPLACAGASPRRLVAGRLEGERMKSCGVDG